MEAANIERLQQNAERNARELLPAFIGIRRVCEISGLSKSTIHRKQKKHVFPMPVLSEGNCVRYDLGEVMAWRAEQFRKRDERSKA